MGNGWIKRFVARYVTGADRMYAELGPFGKFTRLLWISGNRYVSDQNGLRSVALTYYTLFAVVPMLALAFGIAKGFELQERLKTTLAEQLVNQREVLAWLTGFAEKTLEQTQGGLVAGVGVVLLLITVIWLVSSIEAAFNSIWNVSSRGRLFYRITAYLALILITPFLIIILSSAGPVLRQLLGHNTASATLEVELLRLATDLVPLLLVCATFTLVYMIAPNTRVRFWSALLAGIIAGVLFHLLQEGFIILQTRIYRYNKVYGSFAILPLFLIWLKLSWQVTLFGAEVSFIHQHARSGLFDRIGRTKLSLKLRREYQLLILGKVYHTFDLGGGAVDEERLFDELALPQVLVLSLLDELVEANVLYRLETETGDRSYLPSLPADRSAICDVLEKLEEAGLQDLPGISSSLLERVVRNLDGVKRTAATSSCNLPLKSLERS